MTPTDDSNVPDRNPPETAWRGVIAEAVRSLTLVFAHDLIQRAGGWGMAGMGGVCLMIGLGPIGLSLLFTATAVLLLNWEQHHARRDASDPTKDRRKGGR